MALDLAKNGARVAVVSSGDPGVFAMAAAVLEVAAEDQWRGVPVRILPGMTAANAVASRVGAPLGHDYAVLSLSDRLKPWDVVARRISQLQPRTWHLRSTTRRRSPGRGRSKP